MAGWPMKSGTRFLGLVCLAIAAMTASAFDQPNVAVSSSAGPRTLEDQTKAAVVRDYLAAWQTLDQALQRNNPSVLDSEFVGTAKEQLASTIGEQAKLGLQTRYQDRSHDIHLVFYSPEGLSVQLLDSVEYDVQLLDHDQQITTQHVRARYVAVLTPTEVRWKVRVFQATPTN